MTRTEARERALELWGDMGVIARFGAILGIIASLWLVTTAFKTTVEVWLVPRREVEVRDDSLRAYLYRRDSAQAIWLIEDRVWKADMKAEKRRECVRHHGERSCLRND